ARTSSAAGFRPVARAPCTLGPGPPAPPGVAPRRSRSVRVRTRARAVAVTMMAPAPARSGRRRARPRARLGERHGHRERPQALGAVDRTARGLRGLGHGPRDLELETAHGAAEVVSGHDAPWSDAGMTTSYASPNGGGATRVLLVSPVEIPYT